MAGNGESKASEKKIAAAEKQKQALELRKAGVGYEAIAAKVGYSGPSGAYKAIMSALKAITREPAEEFKKMELERLDRLWLAYWKKALDGDIKATDKCLEVSDRRCKIEGAYAPQRNELTGKDGAALEAKVKVDVNVEVVERLKSHFDSLREAALTNLGEKNGHVADDLDGADGHRNGDQSGRDQ